MVRPGLRGIVTAIVVGIVTGGSLGLYTGLPSRPVGMGSGVGPAPRLLAIGSPSGGGGWITLYRGSEPRPFARTQVPWKEYDDEVGSAQPVPLRLGGGPGEQIAVALGPTGSAPGGWIVVLDGPENGCKPLAWRRIVLGRAQGPQTLRLAGGDIDGDGLDELVVGSSDGKGEVLVLDDLAHGLAPIATLRIPWSAYDEDLGETRPAAGDLDGDGKAEVVVGLGAYGDVGGWVSIYRDLRFARWARLPWNAYDANGGGTWPAVGDVDGEGGAQLLLGSDGARTSQVCVLSDPLGVPHAAWMAIPPEVGERSFGEVRPRCADLDGEGRTSVLLDLPEAGGPLEAALFAEGNAGGTFLGWRRGWTAAAVGPVAAAPEAGLVARFPGSEAVVDPSGQVSYLSGRLTQPSRQQPLDAAKGFLQENRDLWGLADLEKDLILDSRHSVLTPGPGQEGQVCLAQAISGVPYPPYELVIHVDPSGVVTDVNGAIDSTAIGVTFNPRPAITSDVAIDMLKKGADVAYDIVSTPELMACKSDEGAFRLAWSTVATSINAGVGRACLIDAVDGALLRQSDCGESLESREEYATATGSTPRGLDVQIPCTYRSLDLLAPLCGVYHGTVTKQIRMLDRRQNDDHGVGDLYTDDRIGWDVPIPYETGSCDVNGFSNQYFNAWGHFCLGNIVFRDYNGDRGVTDRPQVPDPPRSFIDPDAVAVHYNLEKTLRYWWDTFGRRGWDDNPESGVHRTYARVHDRGDVDPAEWCGNGVILFKLLDATGGDFHFRSATTLDIVAHEYAHGVVNQTCNIDPDWTWPAQTAFTWAMKEHLSDAFAVFAERKMRPEVGEANWTIAETAMEPGRVLRNMAWTHDPQAWQQGPDIYDEFRYGYCHWTVALAADKFLGPGFRNPTPEPHLSSLLLSHWLYLWVEGGDWPHDAQHRRVEGLRAFWPAGDARFQIAEQAYYRMLKARRLNMRSDFNAFRLAILDSLDAPLPGLDTAAMDVVRTQANEAFHAVHLPSPRW